MLKILIPLSRKFPFNVLRKDLSPSIFLLNRSRQNCLTFTAKSRTYLNKSQLVKRGSSKKLFHAYNQTHRNLFSSKSFPLISQSSISSRKSSSISCRRSNTGPFLLRSPSPRSFAGRFSTAWRVYHVLSGTESHS